MERELEKVYEKQGARPKTVVKSATTDRPPHSLPKPNIRPLFSSDELQSCPKLDDLYKHSSLKKIAQDAVKDLLEHSDKESDEEPLFKGKEVKSGLDRKSSFTS